MTSSYDDIVELFRTLDIQEANDYLKTGWVYIKTAEVDAPTTSSGPQATATAGVTIVWRRTVLYILGRRESERKQSSFPPPPPPAKNEPKPDGITDKQLQYIKDLERQSKAAPETMVKFLEDRHKTKLEELSKQEAGDLIQFLK